MKKTYNTDSIQELEALDHIRERPTMYIGDTINATHLLIECLDNALDEVQNGEATRIAVSIDEEKGIFTIADNGRGIPFNYDLPPLQDPPILICNKLFTSAKFKKDNETSVYNVAAGLNGVGMTAVHALCEYMTIDIYKNNKHASYLFKHKEIPVRKELKEHSNDVKFSTVVRVKPNQLYFDSINVDTKIIEERLVIAAASFSNLDIGYCINGKNHKIKGSEDHLIKHYLGKNVNTWHSFDCKNSNKDKSKESCVIKLGWDFDSKTTKQETFTSVNFVRVHDGPHITKVLNILKDVFQKISKKQKCEIEPSDCLNWLRLYINLKIIDAHFDGQTKTKLSRKSDITIFDSLEKKIENYFRTNEDITNELLDKFETYRKSLQNKKVVNTGTSKKRGSAKFTKLRDCTEIGGELLIGEGESAVGGIVTLRDPKKTAIMPLRGVPMNVLNHKMEDILKNQEINDLISGIGCGIEPHCDIDKIRYNKILIAADADDAGKHITSLLIILFAKLMPQVIKESKLYIVETPLYAYKENKEFIPLWTDKELENARKNNKKILRIKGLGELDSRDLYNLTLNDKIRKLVKVEWPIDSEKVDKIFKLLDKSGAEDRKKLALNEWSLDSK